MGDFRGLVKGKIDETNQILNNANKTVQQMNAQGEEVKLNNDEDEDMEEGIIDSAQDHFHGSGGNIGN